MSPRDPEEEAPLLPIESYRAHILSGIRPLDPVRLPLTDAWGCVLAQEVRAPADLPPFVSSAMDGYAVRAADIVSASVDHPVELRVTGEVRMGRRSEITIGPGEAVVVPTGGVVPAGADAVVPVELCDVSDGDVHVLRALPAGKHVRPAGEDVRAGELLVAVGRRLRAPDIGALAAAGQASVTVLPRARIGIVSTGDELVRPGAEICEGEIYDSNTYTLIAAIREAEAVPVDGGPVRDEPAALVEALDRIGPSVDVFVCSGGVSMGERDPVKRTFERDGRVEFFNVAMQPGRPQAFGTWSGKPLFGLPGNPVSVFVSFEVFVRPALMKLMGRSDERPTIDAVLDGELEAPRTRARYARVRVRREGATYVAMPEGGHQSNLLATFARADGLAVIAAGTRIETGETCRVLLIRDIA